MTKSYPVLALACTLSFTLRATTYWVATDGNDSNNGTASNIPFATPQKAFTAMAAGDTVYVRGGNYVLDAQLKTSKAGTVASSCKLWAYPGEKPVFDFSTTSAGTKAIVVNKDYWHVKGIEVSTATDNGIFVGGSSGANIGFVIIEGCVTHDCYNDGIRIGSTSGSGHDVLILNCDSYRNYDRGDGNNGDGFSAKEGCSTNNIFRGCRAWNNSDDGWDFYNNRSNSIVLENCWAFANGLNLWNASPFNGNGNGFKLGGNSGAIITKANHVLKNCLAFQNVHKGFDQNSGEGGITLYNCTGYGNGYENFYFDLTPTGGGLAHHVLKNNISYLGGREEHKLAADSVQVSNSWQGFTVNAADFASLSTSSATNARNADFSLPELPMFRLANGSDLINGGVDIGLPFNGSAPDLGAYELSTAAPPQGPISFDGAPQFSNGGFNVRVTGLTSHGPVVLYATSNLTGWTPILTNPAAAGTTQFLDTVTNQPRRFYRAEEK